MNTAKKFNLWMGIALLILCFFIIFVVYPLILILYKSVIDPESSKLNPCIGSNKRRRQIRNNDQYIKVFTAGDFDAAQHISHR